LKSRSKIDKILIEETVPTYMYGTKMLNGKDRNAYAFELQQEQFIYFSMATRARNTILNSKKSNGYAFERQGEQGILL
jgi:hypothetical protein